MRRLIIKIKEFWILLKDTFKTWNAREPFRVSTTIAYYTIFSLPGLLVILINLAGYFFDKEKVTHEITAQIQGMIGGDTAEDVRSIIDKASESKDSTISSVLGIATLLFGATGVFYQLQQILNEMWGVKPKPRQKIFKLIKDRVFSFGLILVVGFLLLVSLVLSAAIVALNKWVTSRLSEGFAILFKLSDIIISLGIVTLLFASIYKFLPDAKIKWRDVWVGAFVTAILFVITKFALGIYFGESDPGSTYGAAGSVILIMLWVSYSGMILLFGAEFTQVYANRYGAHVKPSEGAVSVKQDNNESERQATPKEKRV